MDSYINDLETYSEEEKNSDFEFGQTEMNHKKNPKNKWKERLKGVLIISLFWIMQFIGAIITIGIITIKFAKTQDDISKDIYIATYLKSMFMVMFAFEVASILLIIAIYKKRVLTKIKEAFKPFFKFAYKIIIYSVILSVTGIIFSLIDTALFPDLASQVGDNQEVIELALKKATPTMILSICITAPIVEEFVFRYGIIKKLLFGLNKYIAALIAALIFSFVHIGFSQASDLSMFAHLMLGYLGQALVFSYVFVREDNLVYSIALHVMNNINAVMLIFILYAS